jgi:hypothetical protein
MSDIVNWIVATRRGGIKCRNWDDVLINVKRLEEEGNTYKLFYRHKEGVWVETTTDEPMIEAYAD